MSAPTIEFENHVWTVGPATDDTKKVLERACAAVALADLYAVEADLPPDLYKRRKRDVDANVDGGLYHTGHVGWSAMLTGVRAAPLTLYALIKTNHPEFTYPRAERLVEQQPVASLRAAAAGVADLWRHLLKAEPAAAAEIEKTAALFAEAFTTAADRAEAAYAAKGAAASAPAA